jgi:hypothetical protein
MITVPAGVRVLVATKPVDFRKGEMALSRWFGKRFEKTRFRVWSSSSDRNAPTG